MGEQGGASLRERYLEIERRLDLASRGSGGGEGRDGLKEEIIALFRLVEREIADLSALKDDIKGLVDKWKAITPPAGIPAEQSPPMPARDGATAAAGAAGANARVATPLPAAPAAPTRADHLGASTFIEKGWSRIALGDNV
jgi:hypothetical protein